MSLHTAAINLGSAEFWKALRESPEELAAQVCSIDLVNMEDSLQKHPALRAWVNAAFESARIVEERRKWEVTKARAKALLNARMEMDPGTGKPKTVGVLDAEVEEDPKVQETTEALLETQHSRAILRAMADALEDRKDMLVQIAAKQRKELEDYR